MSMYDDVYIRKNLNDQGEVPATGAYTNSPDIIVSGTMPINHPDQYAKDTWGSDPGVNPVANANNYIYVRGKNLAPGAQSGKMALYFTKASLIMYPSIWLKNQLKNSTGEALVPVEAKNNGDVVVTMDPFTWIPEMIGGDHFCLVGMVGTNAHPMPKPTSDNMRDLATYLCNNPNIAWHNVNVVDNGVDFAVNLNYEQGNIGGTMYVFVECTACPDGAQVSFASGTPLPDGTYVKQDWINIVGCNPATKKHFITGATFEIPANWKSNITYNYKSNGKAPLPGEDWAVEVKVAFYQAPAGLNSELRALADNSDHAKAQAIAVHNTLMATNEKNGSDSISGPGRFVGIGSHKTLGKK
jgi:hypothetical protein